MKNPINRSTDETLLTDLEALHNVHVPELRMPTVPANITPRRHLVPWRPAALAAAAIAGLALFAGGFSPFGGSPSEVNAETILQKTAGVANSNALASTTSYHMVSRNESFWEGASFSVSDSENEVWYRDAEHQRSESRELDGRRAVQGTSQSGNDLWMYATVDGKTRAVHGDIDLLGFRTTNRNEFGADNLSELLALYSGGGCSSAKLVDEEEVADRDTYVIEVTPTLETCPFKVSSEFAQSGTVEGSAKAPDAKMESVTIANAEVKSPNGTPANTTGAAGDPAVNKGSAAIVRSGKADVTTKMWVDAETFIMLKTESYSGGELLFRYEVTEFETGIDIPDSVFEYAPSAGVEVIEATSPADMKMALSDLFATPGEPASEPAAGADPSAPVAP